MLAAEQFGLTLPPETEEELLWEEKLKYREAYVDAMIDMTLAINEGKINTRRLR
jgi:hypothetical protein